MPVILADGVRVAIRVNRGANATLEADKFCAKHGVPEDETEQILKNVKRRHRKRMNRTLLLTFPLTAPDGRTLNFDVRQGEQHDLIQLARDFSLATSMNIDAVQLANIAHKKLRPQIMELPVDLPASRRIILRVRHGDDPQELVEAFCEFLDLPRQNVAPILTAVRKGMNPGAIVVPAVVPDEEEEDEENEDEDGEGKE